MRADMTVYPIQGQGHAAMTISSFQGLFIILIGRIQCHTDSSIIWLELIFKNSVEHLPQFVTLSLCVFVSRITQNVVLWAPPLTYVCVCVTDNSVVYSWSGGFAIWRPWWSGSGHWLSQAKSPDASTANSQSQHGLHSRQFYVVLCLLYAHFSSQCFLACAPCGSRDCE